MRIKYFIKNGYKSILRKNLPVEGSDMDMMPKSLDFLLIDLKDAYEELFSRATDKSMAEIRIKELMGCQIEIESARQNLLSHRIKNSIEEFKNAEPTAKIYLCFKSKIQ